MCAVLLELVQGEGGVLPMDRDFVRELAGLCEERTGCCWWTRCRPASAAPAPSLPSSSTASCPMPVSFAKGIAGGLPMGGFLANDSRRAVLGPGSHATTFGGNPVCAAAALAVLDILDEAALTAVGEGDVSREHIEAMGLHCLGGHPGLGLMIGVEVRGERETNRSWPPG